MKARLIAFYLPQFHPTAENDEWWGKGFTEWINVAKAVPLFNGHYQPHIPADLGFYDLRLPETREAQAALSRKYGIEAFCYWHYWFGNGVRILERPFNEVLSSGRPDFPFCLGWANETWTGIWHGAPQRILVEQKYPGWDDYRRHFDFLLRAFHDRRYVRVNGKPLFVIYRPRQVPECRKAMEFWRELADKAGLNGIHLVAHAHGETYDAKGHGFDAVTFLNSLRPPPSIARRIRRKMEHSRVFGKIMRRLIKKPIEVYHYREAMKYFLWRNVKFEYYPQVMPNWDNTPRSGRNGFVLKGSTPELFKIHLREAIDLVQRYDESRRLVFIKSWNEWAKGNHLEPDQRFGLQYIEVLKEEIDAASQRNNSYL